MWFYHYLRIGPVLWQWQFSSDLGPAGEQITACLRATCYRMKPPSLRTHAIDRYKSIYGLIYCISGGPPLPFKVPPGHSPLMNSNQVPLVGENVTLTGIYISLIIPALMPDWCNLAAVCRDTSEAVEEVAALTCVCGLPTLLLHQSRAFPGISYLHLSPWSSLLHDTGWRTATGVMRSHSCSSESASLRLGVGWMEYRNVEVCVLVLSYGDNIQPRSFPKAHD